MLNDKSEFKEVKVNSIMAWTNSFDIFLRKMLKV